MESENIKTALVTGGSRGIGLGIAKQLAQSGFDLAINGVREEKSVSKVLSELRALGAEVIYCRGNIANIADRNTIFKKVKGEFGKLNVLVNNAGVSPKERKDILETTEESYERVMNINLKGCYFMCQKAANWMIDQKKDNRDFDGCIINVSSISAKTVSVNRGEYCISKAGIAMVTQLYAVRLGNFDIPVYEVQPGIILTDMTAGVQKKYDKKFEEGIAVQKRWGKPGDVGKAVAALANKNFPYSTGQVILVDGGMSIRRL